ncbi:MAG: PEP-CTERM sorting domain-containing protein [Burkholderiales bacterium]|nr:PEP-CTERM sorting domain-containing protein [Burkholderiales bacterium]
MPEPGAAVLSLLGLGGVALAAQRRVAVGSPERNRA